MAEDLSSRIIAGSLQLLNFTGDRLKAFFDGAEVGLEGTQ